MYDSESFEETEGKSEFIMSVKVLSTALKMT
jgi:hypothetical protein